MTMHAAEAITPQPGRVGRALIRMFMKHARVVQVETPANDFHLITIESTAFQGVEWVPGQKVQIAMGSAFVARTYTPMEWDTLAGRTRILAYAHGTGPGSVWARNVTPGLACDVMGPRASLDVNDVGTSCVMLGDETSIALTYAFDQYVSPDPLRCLLEVDDPVATGEVLRRLGLGGVELFIRSRGDAHLEDMASRLAMLSVAKPTFVLTGRAASIQRLRKALNALGVPASRIRTKAYWAPGKTGMD